MADYDRYDTRNLDRDRSRSSSGGMGRRNNQGERSIFNFGRDNDRDDWRGNRDSDRFGSSSGRGGGMSSGGFSGRGGMTGARAGRADYDRDNDHRSRERSGEGDRYYGPDDTREGLARDETGHLIASNKVEGTAVYGRNGERLGDIYNFMVDKKSGHVEYVVMSYGGFLGMGMRYYPLPWDMLTYDTREGGYRVELTERDLENAPSFDRNSEPRYDRSYSGRVHDYYGIRY